MVPVSMVHCVLWVPEPDWLSPKGVMARHNESRNLETTVVDGIDLLATPACELFLVQR